MATFAFIGLLGTGSVAWACLAIGIDGPVTVRGEEALIVWDETTHTEHFIRRALFDKAPANFGFLVPTPGKPELAEVKAPIFDRLYELYKLVERGDTLGMMRGVGDGDGVRVVERKKVAGLDATVLQATDAGALGDWLAAHHYPSSPALKAWLAPYVAKSWYVTAFKLAGGKRAPGVSVRMTFAADAPIYPYSEPPGGKARPFRVSVVAPTRMAPTLGGKPWTAPVRFARPLKASSLGKLLAGVLPGAAPQAAWVTTFDERRSVRGADDLVFTPAAVQKQVAGSIEDRIGPDPEGESRGPSF